MFLFSLDLLALLLVTLLTILFLNYMVTQVVLARDKYSIDAPRSSGNKHFERIYRSQVNSFEGAFTFIPLMWIVGITLNGYFASILGLIWLIFRFSYYKSYKVSSDLRITPYMVHHYLIIFMIIASFIGILIQISHFYL